jgi:SPP1 family predicted phage head-tail adaptor
MFRPTPAGEFRHLVQFQSRNSQQDAAGQPADTWTTYLTTRAKIEILRGQLQYQSDVFINKNTYQITIRYPHLVATGVDAEGNPTTKIAVQDQIVFNSQVYVIQAIINVEQRDRELMFLAYVVNDEE